MVSILLIIWISVFLVATLDWRRRVRKYSKLPPGNISWPIIGETLSLFKQHPATSRGQFLENRVTKFGKFFTSNLLGSWSIVSTDPELNRLILKNDEMFETDWPFNLKRLMSKFSVIFLVGDTHKRTRSAIQNFLNIKRLQTVFLQDANEFASELLSSWDEKEIISAKEEVIKSKRCILRILKQKIGEMIQKQSDEYDTIRRDDFLSCVIKNTDYTVEQLSGWLLNLLFSGYNNIPKAITPMIYFLKGCPKAIEQLREEYVQIIGAKILRGESSPTWNDYKAMEFTQSVIKETLRLGNIAPITFRKSTMDLSYKDFVIPRGCSIFIHTAGMHLDPTLFDNPENFNPWRWLSPSGLKKIDGFMPFGEGARNCVGNRLTQLIMIVFLHKFIMKYDWEFVEKDDPISSPSIDFQKGLKIKVNSLSREQNKQ